MARLAPLAAFGVAALLAVACTPPADPDGSRSPSPTPTPTPTPVQAAELHLPDAATTVLRGTDPVALAAGMSEALWASAPVAVAAPADDVAAQLRAASVAVALGAPLLLTDDAEAVATDGATAGTHADDEATATPTASAGDDPDADPSAAELARLGVVAVVTVGDVTLAVPDGVTVVPAPDDDAALAALVGADLEPADPTPSDAAPAAVARLDRAEPTLLTLAVPDEDATEGADTDTDTDPDALPRTDAPEPLDGGLVLTTGDAAHLAAVATARAAGTRVVTVTSGDPRVDSADVRAIAETDPTATIALGDGFGTAQDLAWRVATAATGVELPGGGQTVFHDRRMVAMYGTPTFPVLGILGEQDVAASIARAQGLAAQYQPYTTDRVVPAFEIIVTIASAGPGDDGNYSNELPPESFVPWIEAARDAGVYVVLDLQPGRTDFVTQARHYEQLLLYPNVGLALDPEWRLAPDQVHLVQIGSVHVDEVNAVADYLAELTRTHHLPQKVLVLHQFALRMIVGRELVNTSHPELAVLIHADGQGSQPAKAGTWQALHQGAPAGVFWGWKNFIDEDQPMLAPEQTYQVQPMPDFVSYQ